MVGVQRRSPHYLFPLLLIAAGLIALLTNLGMVAAGFWDRVFQLWPLILVVFGIELLAGSSSTQPAIRLGAFSLVLLLVAGATFYAIGPWLPASTAQSGTYSAPLNGLAGGRLQLSMGAGSVSVTTADLGSDLYRASYSYTGVAPNRAFDVQGDALRVNLDRGFPGSWFGQTRDRVDLTLNQSIPWAVTVAAGGVDGTLDLRTADLRSLEVNSAAGKLTIQLGTPETAVPVRFNGVAHELTLSAPAGTALRVHASGVATTVVLPDGQTLSAALGDRSWQSAAYPGTAGSYSVEVAGVASKLTLEVPNHE